MDQVFAVRQVCESISRMGKMDSGCLWIWKKQTILSIDMHGMWQILRVHWSWWKIVESSAEFLCR